jgi:predicted RNA-binding Zn-ribbon protein involved in translation (DUF1610 family)
MADGVRYRDSTTLDELRSLAQAIRSLVLYVVENDLDEIDVSPGNNNRLPVAAIAEKFGISVDVLLEESAKRGLLKPFPIDVLVFCPKCGSTTFRVRFKCPSCGSVNVERNTLFSHVTCGYVGILEETIKDSRGKVLCPKCKQELVKEGQDWVKIGVNWKCRDCGSTFTYPKPYLECSSCGTRIDENAALYRQVNRYKVDKKIASDIYSQIFNKRVSEVLTSHGWTVTPASEIKSLSGIARSVSLVAERKGEKVFVYNVFPREGDVEEARRNVLNAYGAALDESSKHLLLSVKTPSEVAKKPENIECIEGGTLDEVIGKLREKLAKEKF